MWLRIRCTVDASVMKATMRISVPQVPLGGGASQIRESSIAQRQRAGERSGVSADCSREPSAGGGCAATADGARAAMRPMSSSGKRTSWVRPSGPGGQVVDQAVSMPLLEPLEGVAEVGRSSEAAAPIRASRQP